MPPTDPTTAAATTTTTETPPRGRRRLAVVLGVLVVAGVAWGVWTLVTDSGGEFDDEAEAAAGWVAREFADPAPDWADFGPGVLADITISLTAADAEPETADAALAALAAESEAYLGEPGAATPGALGKLVLAIEARGQDPATFIEGRDVEAELRGLIAADGAFTGAGPYDQALGILGLAATDEGVPEEAGASLASMQCDAGDFTFIGECPTSEGAEEPDTTAIALQALLATDQDEASDTATTWLLDWQADDGSISSFGAANANSTALTAQALLAAGETDAADRAAAFVAGLQVDQPEAEAGGILFTSADAAPNGFATIQGILAFGAPALDQIEAAGPSMPMVAAAVR